MPDDILKEAEGILEKKEWEEFWREYEAAVAHEDWGRAHSQLVQALIPKLFRNHDKMVEYLKQRDELIIKCERAMELQNKVIKGYEAGGGQR